MIVSWNWLQDYVPLSVAPAQAAERLTMSGFNLESLADAPGDTAIDLEITSNRPDCLGHLGVARELSVLFGAPLRIPDPRPPEAPVAAPTTTVSVDAPELCPQYIARVIRGVRIGPSPAWLQQRLQAVGLATVNNVVDATNYVLMECGQPLHAFDFDRLQGGRIVVRTARKGERIEAIDHRVYELPAQTLVIADAARPVAVAGVMGGADSEVHAGTANLLIESAAFAPAAVRSTARLLNLHSPSSHRFERGVDLEQIDWASRRCCELILQTAGGELAGPAVRGAADVPRTAAPIRLRFARIPQVLGVGIPEAECLRVLQALELQLLSHEPGIDAVWRAPSRRRDLVREIDLIEELARIHGYHHIPENCALPTAVAPVRLMDRVRDRVHGVLTAAGLQETISLSLTTLPAHALFPTPSAGEPLQVSPAAGEYGAHLRQSLIPSLVLARRENERRRVLDAELFEIARTYLGVNPDEPRDQPLRLALVSGRSFREVKGLLEAVVRAAHPQLRLTARPSTHAGFRSGRQADLLLNGAPWGWMGELDRDGFAPLKELKLREPATAAEVDFTQLVEAAALTRTMAPPADRPEIDRDLNLVIDEALDWDTLTEVLREAAGPWLESLTFVDQYRGQQIPAGKKSYVLRMTYRAGDRTLTGEEVDAAQAAAVAACERKFGAVQR